MCGIAGIVKRRNAVSNEEITYLLNGIKHRGPDNYGTYIKDNVGLCHARLSIIDISSNGNQPFHKSDLSLVFNGEIYNYRKLKQPLVQSDSSFISNSDTEVLAELLNLKNIEDVCKMLDGMFAFAAYKHNSQLLYLARDRFGKKPLYYYIDNDIFCFASEIDSIYNLVKNNLSLNSKTLNYFLSEISSNQPFTIWNEIKQVKNAHILSFSILNWSLSETEYWHLNAGYKYFTLSKDLLENIEFKLIEAIRKRTVADVPISTFLSGGIDSGLVNGILAQKTNLNFKAFTFSSGGDDDEAIAAKTIAEYNGISHTIQSIDTNYFDVRSAILQFGEPFADQSILPTDAISKAISISSKVAFSGDGGDEIFGGYYDYVIANYSDYLNELSQFHRSKKVFSSKLISRFDKTNFNYGNAKTWGALPNSEKLFRNIGFSKSEKTHLLIDKNHFDTSFPFLEKIWEENHHLSDAHTLMLSSLKTRLLNNYLVKVDRMSMKYGVEVRNPFLDTELVELAFSIHPRIKLHQGVNKYLLRQIAPKYVGESVSKLPKKGFGADLNNLIRTSLKSFITQSINELDPNENLFSKNYVNKLLENHLNNAQQNGDKLWILATLSTWNTKYKGF